jgi:MFS family permease
MSGIIPPGGPRRVLAVAELAGSIGDGAFYACSALYFTRVVGLSATEVGLALTLGAGIGMAAGVPLGYSADRWGPRRATVLVATGSAVTLSALLAVRTYPLFLLVVSAQACCQSGLNSGRQALVAGLASPDQRTRFRAYLQATRNAGLAVGSALGGVALSIDTRPAYLVAIAGDAASVLVAALVLSRLPEVPSAPVEQGEPRLAVLRDRPYALITLLNALMCVDLPLLILGLPLWIAQHTDAPKALAAAVQVVNMVFVVLFQIRVAGPVTDARTAGRAARRAGWFMLAACVVCAFSGGHRGAVVAAAILLVAAVIQVFGEMMLSAAGWELSFGLAPADRHGQYQGFFGMGPQFARMLGPVLLTTLLLDWGTPGWFVLGGVFLGAGLAVPPAARWAESSAAGRAAARELAHGTVAPTGTVAG